LTTIGKTLTILPVIAYTVVSGEHVPLGWVARKLCDVMLDQMQIYEAASVIIACLDFDYGEGWIEFEWADQARGTEALRITLDGHCSRKMPIRSGDGWPTDIELAADRIRLRFDAELAAKLEFAELIEIRFTPSDEQYQKLQDFVRYLHPEG
jgi:hypothetical protein